MCLQSSWGVNWSAEVVWILLGNTALSYGYTWSWLLAEGLRAAPQGLILGPRLRGKLPPKRNSAHGDAEALECRWKPAWSLKAYVQISSSLPMYNWTKQVIQSRLILDHSDHDETIVSVWVTNGMKNGTSKAICHHQGQE